MNKIVFWGTCGLALLACSRMAEEEPVIYETQELVFTAYGADGDVNTKTARQADNVSVHWSPADAISVFFINGENGGSKFVAQNTEEVEIAQFKGTIDVVSGGGEGEMGEFWFWGVYPYSTGNSCDGSSITTVIPAQQVGKAGTFADNTFVTMARSKGLSLAFYNICCGVKFTLTRDDVKAVSIRGNNGEDIAGKVKVVWDQNGKPAITDYLEGAKEVTVTAPGNGTFEIGEDYYLVVAPELFSEGFTLSLTTSDSQQGYFVYENSRQFNRGKFIVIPDLDTRVTTWIDVATKEVPEEGGEVTLEFFSDVPCHAVIPEDAQSWISVAPPTRGMTRQTIDLIVQPNDGLSRSATINVVGEDDASNLVLSYTINQESNHDAQLAIEREVMISLYEIGKGENWDEEWGYALSWCTNQSVGNWAGITTDESGYITELRIIGYSGYLPESLGVITHLKTLVIVGHIVGEIPSAIGQLSELEILYLSGDAMGNGGMVGSIPKEVFSLKNLRELSFPQNSLTGGISADFGMLKKLEVLNLENNRFTGTLPKELAQCEQLRSVNLKFNRLSGVIPQEIMHCAFWRDNWGKIIQEYSNYVSVFWGENNNFSTENLIIPAPILNSYYFTDGTRIVLNDIYPHNKLTLLYDWGETDGYWPIMKSINDYYHDKGLEIIGFNNHDNLQEVVEQNNILWKNSPYALTYPGEQTTSVDGVYQKHINVIDSQGYVVYSNYYQPTNLLIPFLNTFLDGSLESPYVSDDYSIDGRVERLQSATLGDGINIILMGDAFSDRQIKTGEYRKVMERAMNAFFKEEPFITYREAFNVYLVDVVSVSEGYDNDGQALKTWIGSDGIRVNGYDTKVINYALKAIPESKIDDALVIVLLNLDASAGTCYMYNPPSGNYGRGLSIAYFPVSSDTDTFNGLVSHEAGGHGFAKLADEYAYEDMGAISADAIASTKVNEPYGWWKNVDFTSDPAQVKWSQFLSDPRYANEGLGCYEGGLTYWSGVWRPTGNSIMRYNTDGFNAPSRYAIWYRIGKLAYGESWEGSYEDFVAYDAVNRTPAAAARCNAQRRNYVEKPLPPLPAPVVVGHSWREELQKGKWGEMQLINTQ